MTLFINILLLILGFVMLSKGSDWFVEGASGVAGMLRIPSIVIGLTIVAMGTSLPEASVSIVSALKGSADISIGNVLGSNIMNILLILGITSAIASVPVGASTIRVEIPFMIFVSICFAVFSITGLNIVFPEGVGLWILFIIYILYLIRTSKTARDTQDNISIGADEPGNEPSGDNKNIFVLIFLIIIGAILIIGGSNVTVRSATDIARIFGVSERIIGLTIVAFGTSLPELFTSATAALRGETDIAIGNIVGSNIFNILFVLGTSALVIPIPFSTAFIPDMIITILSALLLYALCRWKKGLVRICGIIMLLCYACYFIYLLKM